MLAARSRCASGAGADGRLTLPHASGKRATRPHTARCADMPIPLSSRAPEGSAAYREFELALRDGRRVNVAFTLARKDHKSLASTVARQVGAVQHGLASAVDSSDALAYPFYWFFNGVAAVIVPADRNKVPDKVLRSLVARLIEVFFASIEDVAPELAARRALADVEKPFSQTLH